MKRSRIALFALTICCVLSLAGCGNNPTPTEPHDAPLPINKFDDPKIVRIYDLADRREGDSLLPYLSDSLARIRREAALVMGSVQDAHALPQLQKLLQDQDTSVVAASAWALGQIGDSTAAQTLLEALQHTTRGAQSAVGEAIGKCGSVADITQVIGMVRTQRLSNDAHAAAMQAVYRAGLRKRIPSEAQSFAFEMLADNDAVAQRYAAAFLGRVADSGPIQDPSELLGPMRSIQDHDIRQLLVRAFARCKDTACTRYLQALVADAHENPLVRANGFRASGGMHDLVSQARAAAAGIEEQVAVAAAEYLEQAFEGSSADLLTTARQVRAWRPRSILLKKSLQIAKPQDRPSIIAYVDSLIAQGGVYEQAALYAALAASPDQHDRLVKMALEVKPVVSIYAWEAYLGYFSKSSTNNRPVIEAIRQVMRTGDPGLIALSADHISAADVRFISQITKADFLDSTLQGLHLPADIEAYNAVLKAKAKVNATPYVPHELGFQNPIDWNLVRSIPTGQTAEIVTSKGKIVMQLHVEDAPGSVANFVKLAQSGFFNGKKIHRMVPSFVAQGGCPRGDGWGSTPETIRSEWAPRHYRPGTVGMASAGKDTESCQWFITHCTVPHLDGRYTIFADVVSGLDVALLLEVGDDIVSVTLPGFHA